MRPCHVTYLSTQSQNDLIELIDCQVQKWITKEIKKAEMYLVMADTKPDVSRKYCLTIAYRYVDAKDQPREPLISVTETRGRAGEGGADEIIKVLNKHEMYLKCSWHKIEFYIFRIVSGRR